MKNVTPTAVFSFSAFVALVAMHGESFFKAFGLLPEVLAKFSKLMPLGTGSFFLSLTMAAIAWYFVHRRTPQLSRNGDARAFRSELVALLVGICAMLLQSGATMPTASEATVSAVYAVMLGILAGFLAPFIMKGVLALIDRLLRTKLAP